MATHDEALRTFVVGLKNAHAMEKQALSIMKPQLSRIANYPEIADRLRKHIGETEMQLKRVDTILNDLRERHSAVKDMMLSVGGSMASLSHVITGDEILKNTFANYAFEHYEIAAYGTARNMALRNRLASSSSSAGFPFTSRRARSTRWPWPVRSAASKTAIAFFC